VVLCSRLPSYYARGSDCSLLGECRECGLRLRPNPWTLLFSKEKECLETSVTRHFRVTKTPGREVAMGQVSSNLSCNISIDIKVL
jgi:hypothetical protein